jgi:two-component sensor histidine kinase
VVLQKTDHTFDMMVADDGKGLPEGLELETVQTLGLRLVHTLIKQIQGEVTISRGFGTEFRIRFKETSRPDPTRLLKMTDNT